MQHASVRPVRRVLRYFQCLHPTGHKYWRVLFRAQDKSSNQHYSHSFPICPHHAPILEIPFHETLFQFRRSFLFSPNTDYLPAIGAKLFALKRAIDFYITETHYFEQFSEFIRTIYLYTIRRQLFLIFSIDDSPYSIQSLIFNPFVNPQLPSVTQRSRFLCLIVSACKYLRAHIAMQDKFSTVFQCIIELLSRSHVIIIAKKSERQRQINNRIKMSVQVTSNIAHVSLEKSNTTTCPLSCCIQMFGINIQTCNIISSFRKMDAVPPISTRDV